MNTELLKKLSLVNGISGHEKYVSRLFKEEIKPYVDDITYDQLGSIIGYKKGKGLCKVLLTAHIDEIGFCVQSIDKQGFIHVVPVGGWMGQNLPSSLMTITTRDERQIPAVFGAPSPHGKTEKERNKVTAPKDALLDVGVSSKEEVEALGIRIGDPVTPVSEYTVMGNPKNIMGKAWDDRAGVAVLLLAASRLKDSDADIYFAGTVQEEVGLRGAKTVGQMIKPDIALAIDVTFSKDTPGESGDTVLGSGVALSVMDGSVIAHTGLLHAMEDICERKNIPYTLDMLSAGGTDSGELSKVESGVINMTLSIPTRYMHSHRTIVNIDDIDATVSLVVEFLESLDDILYQQILEDKR